MVLATLLWLAPRFRQRLTVRSFRKALANVDLVALAWAQSGAADDNDDFRTTPPEEQRMRRRRGEHPDDGGASLV